MHTQPTSDCRIFLSRNIHDCHVAQGIREKLEDLSGSLVFFDDGDIDPGEGSKLDEAFTSTASDATEVEKMLAELDAIGDEFEREVKPRMDEALRSQSITKLREALELWKKNNGRFLELCLQRFKMLID